MILIMKIFQTNLLSSVFICVHLWTIFLPTKIIKSLNFCDTLLTNAPRVN